MRAYIKPTITVIRLQAGTLLAGSGDQKYDVVSDQDALSREQESLISDGNFNLWED